MIDFVESRTAIKQHKDGNVLLVHIQSYMLFAGWEVRIVKNWVLTIWRDRLEVKW